MHAFNNTIRILVDNFSALCGDNVALGVDDDEGWTLLATEGLSQLLLLLI